MTLNDELILGGHNLTHNESTQVFARIANIVVHEEFEKRTWLNDIALLRLSQPIEYNQHIWPVALPSRYRSENMSLEGKVVTMIGWGRTLDPVYPPRFDSKLMSSVPMKADALVIPWDICVTGWNSIFSKLYIFYQK